jgi:MFS transporter, UMF1 family
LNDNLWAFAKEFSGRNWARLLTSGRVMAWISFDPVTSAYAAIVPVVLFPAYFQGFAGEDGGINVAWGLLAASGTVTAGFAALFAAGLSRLIPPFWLLCGFTVMLTASTFSLSIPTENSLLLPALGYLAAQASYSATMVMYESFLPAVADGGRIHRISSLGWAAGFTGGIAGILMLLVLVDGASIGAAIYQNSFALIAALTAVLAFPVLVLLNLLGFANLGPPPSISSQAGVFSTLRDWRMHKNIFVLLLSVILIYSATSIVVFFTAPILTSRFGTSYNELLYLLLLLQVLSIPSTYLVGELSQRWSKRIPIFLVLVGWGFVTLLLSYGDKAWMIWLIVATLGCCVGPTNAMTRSLLAESLPSQHAAVFFGYLSFSGRIGSALGPLIFITVAKLAGERVAFDVALALLAAGATGLFVYLRPMRQVSGPTA